MSKIKIDGYNAYKLYLSIKYHFTKESYDFIKYNGQVKASVDSFNVRKDKRIFNGLSFQYSHQELIGYYIANMLYGNDNFLYDRFGSSDRYNKHISYISDKFNSFTKEIENITLKYGNINKLVEDNGTIPQILSIEFVQRETLFILCQLLDLENKWKSNILLHLTFPDLMMRLRKLKTFFINSEEDLEKYSNIINNIGNNIDV